MTQDHTARLAGFIYVLLVLTGFFNLAYVPSQLHVWSDPGLTVQNIQEHTMLFRSGIVVGVFCYILYLLLAFVLFDLFKDINRRVAVTMVLLAAASEAGAVAAGYEYLNLPTDLSGEFDQWLQRHFPEQAERVFHLSQANLSSSANEFARMVQQRFQLCCQQLGLNRNGLPVLDTSRFQQ